MSQEQFALAELSATQEARGALQEAVATQEEAYASQQQTLQSSIWQRISESRREFCELSAVVEIDKARLQRDTADLDVAMHRIGPLRGELLCVETAVVTEAEALTAVRRDMDAENAACCAARQRVETMSSEIATLK